VPGAILATTMRLLEARGYEALKVEEVARRARVNKTSVYRRYPTKAELVVAAIVAAREGDDQLTPTGKLREDLIAHLLQKAERLQTPRGRAVALCLTSLEAPAVAAMLDELRRRRFLSPADLLDAAVARGDLPPSTDTRLINELLQAPIYYRAIVLRAPVDVATVTRTVDHVLAAIAPSPKQRKQRVLHSLPALK
jgi:AcrR family transcriptional regulator